MLRRNFIKNSPVLLTVPTFLNTSKKTKKIKPPRLKKGGTVAFITPGSFLDDEGLEKAVKNVEGLGCKVVLSKNIRKQYGFVAGTDAERLEDLHWAFSNKDINAIWCARGGYGCSRLLPNINYNLIKKNPKILIGFSDITALVNAIYLKTGLVTFHGPVGASDFTEYTKEHLIVVLMEGKEQHIINLPNEELNHEPIKLNAKKIKGEIAGGNLSLLAAMAGTPYAVDFKNKFAIIEDVGEKPYRIDRMLTQLRQACNLSKSCGIALGDFSGCDSDKNNSLTLDQTLRGQLDFKNVPVGYRFPFGHTDNHCTLPIGINAELDIENNKITLLESSVI